ncbi:unnamed protein product [Tilletia controversa]|nr:unnamed protein product [Tilletia controversa]
MSSHASTSPSLPGRRPRVHHQQHHDDGLDVPTLDPRTLATVAEMRTIREDSHARFDAVTVRLTAVEQQHQHRPERGEPVDNSVGIDPAATVDHGRRTSIAPIHPPPDRNRASADTAWSPALLEDRFVTTSRGPTRPRPAHPPITPRQPPAHADSHSRQTVPAPGTPHSRLLLARFGGLVPAHACHEASTTYGYDWKRLDGFWQTKRSYYDRAITARETMTDFFWISLHGGDDLKTGQTTVKSIIVEFLLNTGLPNSDFTDSSSSSSSAGRPREERATRPGRDGVPRAYRLTGSAHRAPRRQRARRWLGQL